MVENLILYYSGSLKYMYCVGGHMYVYISKGYYIAGIYIGKRIFGKGRPS